MKVEGKTVIITGGANGIGEAAVRLFMDAGANVVIADYNEEAGMRLLNDLDRPQGSARSSLHAMSRIRQRAAAYGEDAGALRRHRGAD